MRRFAILASFCWAISACSNPPPFPYRDARLGVDRRVEDLLRRMTPQERRDVERGSSRLGIPALKLGAAASDVNLEATWNPDLVLQLGRVMAVREPVFAPRGGDPWLESRIAVAWVSGVQSEGGIAVMRNLPCGGSDERTMHERQLPPFRAAIEEAGLWVIDAGRCAGDDALLSGTITRDWGFRGFVFPSPRNDVDDHARRVLRAMFAAGLFDGPLPRADPAEQRKIERTAAEAGVVLLKNDGGFLPLYASRLPSIAVTGSKEQVDAIRARAGSTPVVEGNAGGNASGAGVKIVFSGNLVSVGPALLQSESAQGATDVIFGDVNPSGRLPAPVQLSGNERFPFGFGLSYTTFDWSDLRIFPATPRYGQQVQVVVKVRNTGSRAGAETVELYINKALKAFQQVELKPGETKDVALTLDHHSMSFYDPLVHDWAARPGVFEVELGTSERDIRMKGSFQLFR